MALEFPKWHKDLEIYEGMKTTFIVEGNVHDLQGWVYPREDMCEHISLNEYLYRHLDGIGYETVTFYNRVDGFHNDFSQAELQSFFDLAGTTAQDCKTFEAASVSIRQAMGNVVHPLAVVFELANTALSSPEMLSEKEMECFTRLFLASRTCKQAVSSRNGRLLTNLLFLIVEKINDIPAWFYINNPFVKCITITKPDRELRKACIMANLSAFSDHDRLTGDEQSRTVEELSGLTEGLTNAEVFGVLALCEQRQLPASRARDAVNLFKYGETESHWDKLNHDRIVGAEALLTRRVKGQPRALAKVVDILSRACTGLSGIQSRSSGRPKGVLFFAGPTGTGKTELAKAIAELVFGDEKFVTRFDMSEYGQSHSDQKLLGAPPGYVGYEAGGQLTNAVKEHPFSVLLFDEIEKAHPSILDKFLQILEDGRMTDSSGETVYFSETLIIFTSNLGMVDRNAARGARKRISMDMPFSEIQEQLLTAIKEYFIMTIGRPELLNRIGDNFVIFDFIREEVAGQILNSQLDSICTKLQEEKEITLDLSESFRRYLYEKACCNLENGGRGIGNVVESVFINPLSRTLLRHMPQRGSRLKILSAQEDGSLEVELEKNLPDPAPQ